MAENEERYPTKKSPLPEKKTAFLSGISLHFRPFVVRYGFGNLVFRLSNERDINFEFMKMNLTNLQYPGILNVKKMSLGFLFPLNFRMKMSKIVHCARTLTKRLKVNAVVFVNSSGQNFFSRKTGNQIQFNCFVLNTLSYKEKKIEKCPRTKKLDTKSVL